MSNTTTRPLYEVAMEIKKDWAKVNFGAEPYLNALLCLNKPEDSYGVEDGKTQIIYFLSNANSWKGETAKRIKKELNAMIK